ncbi:hypothetical protein [Streptomyces sp. NPDC051704]|uniref:hypothetical protein n=1 Tax=Streptomyces sp. NPDC051704 TaxID=3365671 RepID=UPI0037A1D4DD
MVGQVLRALTTPPGTSVRDGPGVSATAARSTPTGAAPGQAAPTEPAAAAHRR